MSVPEVASAGVGFQTAVVPSAKRPVHEQRQERGGAAVGGAGVVRSRLADRDLASSAAEGVAACRYMYIRVLTVADNVELSS